MSTAKRQPIDYAEQVRLRREAARAAQGEQSQADATAGTQANGSAATATPGGANVQTAPQPQPTTPADASPAPPVDAAPTPPRAEPTPPQPPAAAPNGLSADTPIAEKKKVDRQGIDLRPEDRERVIRFEMFCLQNRVNTGKKRGLTLYARAGFQLLEELIASDHRRAEALLRSLGEKR